MKAIMVTDMPENCTKCDYLAENYDGDNICAIEFENKNYEKIENIYKKPEWCPFKKLPEKHNENSRVVGEEWAVFNKGWNACLDDILGQ